MCYRNWCGRTNRRIELLIIFVSNSFFLRTMYLYLRRLAPLVSSFLASDSLEQFVLQTMYCHREVLWTRWIRTEIIGIKSPNTCRKPLLWHCVCAFNSQKPMSTSSQESDLSPQLLSWFRLQNLPFDSNFINKWRSRKPSGSLSLTTTSVPKLQGILRSSSSIFDEPSLSFKNSFSYFLEEILILRLNLKGKVNKVNENDF